MARNVRFEAAMEFAERTWPPGRAPRHDPRSRLNELAQSQPSTIAGVLEFWLGRPAAESEFCVKS